MTQTITVKPSKKRGKIRVELDAEQFERLAANLRLFRSEFLESLNRAENDIKEGNIKRLRGLKDLRRKE